jgi:hypothetical protein
MRSVNPTGDRAELRPDHSQLQPKLLDQVREVMRLKHYSIRTERSYCDWIRRYIYYHGMRSREDLQGAEPKIEQFLSHLPSCFNALLMPPRNI